MDGDTCGRRGLVLPGPPARALSAFIVAAALLCLDGQLGPLSFTLGRAVALAALGVMAASRIVRCRRPLIRAWVAIIGSFVLVSMSPSVPVALLAFVPFSHAHADYAYYPLICEIDESPPEP